MLFNPASLFCGLLAVVSVSAKVFNVVVGDNNALVFNPTSISGAVAGDQITFQFVSKNHTATQSTFDNPCTKSSNALFDSGYLPATQDSPQEYTVTLDDKSVAAPLWFYCAQTNPVNHCQGGMVFAVNPTAEKTFDQYQTNAKNSANSPPGGSTTGGTTSGPTGSNSTVHTVLVGSNNTLTFDPPSVQAVAGDTIAFTFVSKNHTATQSTFDNPCTIGGDGLDSGYQSIPQGSTQAAQWSITLDANSTSKPLWFFCAQTAPINHCNKGMVFAVNPTADKTFDMFKNKALAATSTNSSTSSGTGASTGAPASSSTKSTVTVAASGGSASATDSSASSTPTSGAIALTRVNTSILVVLVSVVAALIM